MATGNYVGNSQFHIFDLTAGTDEIFNLPHGTGNVSIPHIDDEYVWNATGPGWIGFQAIVPFTDGTLINSCSRPPLTANLYQIPPNANTTLLFTVQGLECVQADSLGALTGYVPGCVIPGATIIILNNGLHAITNSMGSVSIGVNQNTDYNYSVSKVNYHGYSGNVSVGTETLIPIHVYLSAGTFTTATQTTFPPNVPHDTTGEGIDFIKQNALAIIEFLFLIFFIGGLKMIAKW